MDIKFEKTSECEGTIRTYADATEIAGKRKDILNRFARSARIPGFRPGKVPMSVIIRHFQKDTEDVLLSRLSKESADLINALDADVQIVNTPNPEINVQEDGAYELLFHVSFVPPFELPRYEGIEISQVDNDVDEEEVSNFLRNLAWSEVTYTEVDRPATMDDRVILDFKSTVEGKSLSEFCGRDVSSLDSRSDCGLNLKNAFLPPLAEGLVGAVAGEERVVGFEPDENFYIPELRGKHVVFTCKIKKIQSIQVPDIESKDFVSAHGAPDLPTLRSSIRTILEASKKRDNINAQKTQISNYIASHVDFPLPRQIVEAQMNAVLGGLHASETVDDATRDSAREEAVRILHTYFTLCAIAEKEGLLVTDNDLAQKVTEIALSEGEKNIKSFIRKLQEEGRMDAIRATTTVDKVLAFLLEKARVVPSTESSTSAESPSETPSVAKPGAQTDASPEVSPTEVAEQRPDAADPQQD